MRVFLKPSLVVAASLAACAAVTTSWSLAVAQQAVLSQPDLQELESLLKELGFDPGPTDGVVDEATIAAIKQYQEFASLAGDPVPSEALLIELRGVAAAFAALRNDPLPESAALAEDAAPGLSEAPAEETPENRAPTAGASDGDPSGAAPPDAGSRSGEADAGLADPVEKVIVPPPPAPPKLKPQDADPEGGDAPAQLAARPAEEEAAGEESAPAESAKPAVPVDPRQARIDAALAPYRKDLASGKISREALARRFNGEGRQLLQAAQYEAAVEKFDVAIHLSPRFAGAYSNRGTAYELLSESERAAIDFERARELGFGGVRPQERADPLR